MDVNTRLVDRDVSIGYYSSDGLIFWSDVFISCSGISLAAVTLSGMVNFFRPEFVATAWQVYLFYVATAVITSN